MIDLSANSSQIIAAARNASSGRGPYSVLVALSGGPDSVALLMALKLARVPIKAAHCNFHLRGEESDRDQRFVQELCARHEVPLFLQDFDVAEEQKRTGASMEMACRALRYEWFRQLKRDNSFFRLAVGHNADDNIETLLLNLLRGSGLSGLKGMVEDTGEIIRPLLQFPRKNLLDFLDEIGETYITDSTNLESDARRNFLRNEVIPLLESRWEGLRTSLGRSISILQADERILNHFIRQAMGSNRRLLPWDNINAFPDPSTLIFYFIHPYSGSSHIAMEVARSLPKPRNGKRWKLSDKAEAISTPAGLEIVSNETEDTAEQTQTDEMQFAWEIIEGSPELIERIRHEADNSVAYLPYPESRYELRKVSPMARIHPLGMRGSQLVVNILRESGFSVDEKRRIRLLVDKTTGQIIWVPGLKRARHHLLTGTESKIYKITKLS